MQEHTFCCCCCCCCCLRLLSWPSASAACSKRSSCFSLRDSARFSRGLLMTTLPGWGTPASLLRAEDHAILNTMTCNVSATKDMWPTTVCSLVSCIS